MQLTRKWTLAKTKHCFAEIVFLYLIFPAALLFLGQSPAEAAPIPSSLGHCGKFQVADVHSGDSLKDTDGQLLRLAAIKAPEVWPDGAAYRTWPHGEKSKSSLSQLVSGKTLELFCSKERQTFDGQLVAHALLPNGHWLQHTLLEKGDAFLFPRAEETDGIETLYAAELVARSHERGLWQKLDLLANAKDNPATGRFKIVSGTVISVARRGDRIFLNFGDNWREDFPVEIPRRFWRHFEKAEIDLLALGGQVIEARGWVTWKGGPHILLEGPGQLKLKSSQN